MKQTAFHGRDASKGETENDRPLRVLILSKDLGEPGGVVHFVSFLLNRFSKDIAAEHLAIGRLAGGSRLGNLFFPVVNVISLLRRLGRGRYDCIHVNPSLNFSSLLRDGLFIAVLRLARYRNILVYFHGWSDEDAGRIGRSPLLRSLFLGLFGRSCVIMVLASRFKRTLEEMGVSPSRVLVTTTMFDGGIFREVREERAPRNGKTLLFMSRFVREKGMYELLEAFSRLAKRRPDVRLILLGDGPEREGMEAFVAGHGLGDRVQFTGYVRRGEKARYLQEADLFVFPTYYGEGCPVALLEAMAAGLPVITHGAGGIPDIFRDGEHGVLLDRVEPRAIEEAIEGLLSDEEGLRAIGQRNRTYAWKYFEAEVVTKMMEGVYRKTAECARW